MDATTQRMHSVLEQTARALECSADLADRHAERHELAGRMELAGYEKDAAVRARAAAQRARDHVK